MGRALDGEKREREGGSFTYLSGGLGFRSTYVMLRMYSFGFAQYYLVGLEFFWVIFSFKEKGP